MSCLSERSYQQLQIQDGPTALTPASSSSVPPTRRTANCYSTVQSTAASTASNVCVCVCEESNSMQHLLFTVNWSAQEWALGHELVRAAVYLAGYVRYYFALSNTFAGK